jgi:hypothetical protein
LIILNQSLLEGLQRAALAQLRLKYPLHELEPEHLLRAVGLRLQSLLELGESLLVPGLLIEGGNRGDVEILGGRHLDFRGLGGLLSVHSGGHQAVRASDIAVHTRSALEKRGFIVWVLACEEDCKPDTGLQGLEGGRPLK